jgi:hypothetical protein
MAKVVFGGGVAEMRNKLGSVVYTRSRGGAVARALVTTGVRHTDIQTAQRALFKSAIQRWYTTLSEDQRAAWRQQALLMPKLRPSLSPRIMSGQNLYVSINARALNQGAGPYDDVPNPFLYRDTPAIVQAECNIATTSYLLDVSPRPTGTTGILIWISRTLSPGIWNYHSNMKNVYWADQGDTWPLELWDDIVGNLITPAAGKQNSVLIRAFEESTWWLSPARQQRVICS